MGRGSSKVGMTFEDIGFGKVKNPLPQISYKILGEALSKLPAEAWDQKNYKTLPISSLVSEQNYLIKADLNYYESKGFGTDTAKGTADEVTVVHYQGKNIIMDGNHRVILDLKRGKKKINVRYLEV